MYSFYKRRSTIDHVSVLAAFTWSLRSALPCLLLSTSAVIIHNSIHSNRHNKIHSNRRLVIGHRCSPARVQLRCLQPPQVVQCHALVFSGRLVKLSFTSSMVLPDLPHSFQHIVPFASHWFILLILSKTLPRRRSKDPRIFRLSRIAICTSLGR